MRSATRPSVLLCGFCLAFAIVVAVSAQASGTQLLTNRFGRTLSYYSESPLPSYLLPTQLPKLCHGSSCCQEDDYTSAFQVMMLNSSQALYGGRTYTTFFMNLQRSYWCDTDVDTMGCCNANVSTIWIDIDPNLKVLYTRLNAQRWESITQDALGFRMSITPEQYLALPPSTLMSVTVAGAVEQLCPMPDIAPVAGLCDIILEGGIPGNPNACCPRGVSRPSTISNWIPPNTFSCQADSAVSPFSLAQSYVSSVYIGADGVEYVDYVLTLSQNRNCREGPNSCCGMHLSDLEMKVMASAQITSVVIETVSYKFTTSDWHDQESDSYLYKVLSVEGLEWPVEDIPRAGAVMVVTVKIPSEAAKVPQLCGVEDGFLLGSYGACSYFFYSKDGFCCPSGITNTVTGPIIPTVCNPTQAVPIADTNFGFMYYEHLTFHGKSDFAFTVTNAAVAGCDKPHCEQVCGWELAIQESIAPQVAVFADTSANQARTLVQRGPNAAILFSYAAGSDHSSYVVSTPPNTPLASLCRANAYPDQGSFPCAATIRGANVYAIVFFSETDIVIKINPDICENSQPLDLSCLRPTSSRFNLPDDSSVLDIQLSRADPSTGCQAYNDLTFEVILKQNALNQLASSNAVQPRDGVSYNMTSGVEWSTLPTASNSAPQNYTLRVDGTQSISDVCFQALPGQPKDTCMIQLRNKDTCFSGYINPLHDPDLIWGPPRSGAKPPVKASVVVPAVLLPVLAVIAAVAAIAFFVRRRRNAYAAAAEGEGDLQSPLTGDVEPSEASLASAAASDVHVRVPRRSSGTM